MRTDKKLFNSRGDGKGGGKCREKVKRDIEYK